MDLSIQYQHMVLRAVVSRLVELVENYTETVGKTCQVPMSR